MTSRNIFFGTTSQGKISYDIATDNFILGNSNTDLLHLNSNTNVGVGFAIAQTPTFRLDVSGGDINTDGSYRINGVEVLTEDGLGSGITQIGPLDSLVINNDLTVDGTTLYVDSSGNQVGIGTTAPNFTLDVNGNASIGTTLVVEGDLIVNGTLTTINTETLTVEDPLIKLASQNVADTVDTGFYALYNDGTSKYAGLFRDASDEVFKFFTGTTIEPTTTIDITPANGYTEGNILVGHITASTATVSNDLIVDTDTLFVDSSADSVGINKAVPTEALDVVGNIGISGNVLPTLDATFDLGTTSVRFRDLFLSSATLHIGEVQMGSTSNQLTVTGNMVLENDLTINGSFNSSGAVDLGDNLTLTGTLGVTGTGTFENNLVVNGNTTMVGNLIVDTNTLSVDSTNNRVGVGITNPSVPLDVVGDINTSTDYNIGGAQVLSSTTLGNAVVNSSLTNVATLTSLEISGDLLVDTDTLFVDSGNNRVGIGTTGPLFELDVSGDINSTGSDYRINGTSVLNATTLGSGVASSSLTSNAGNLTNTGTLNLTTGNDYQINSVSVLNATTLGGNIASSNLTSVGTLTTLNVSGDLAVDSNTLYVDASANSVGIGTTVPVSTLDIVADTALDNDETSAHGLRIQTGNIGQSLLLGYDGTDDVGYINASRTGVITDLVLQARGGNVGIGITNPTTLLEILTPTTNNTAALRITNDTVNSSASSGILLRTISASGGDSFIDFDIFGVGGWRVGLDNSDSDKFKISRGAPAAFGTNDFFVIDTSGNVGIDSVAPSALLSLGVTLANTKFAIFDAGTGATFGMGVQPNEFGFNIAVTANKYTFYDTPDWDNDLLTILGSGNIGINIATPETKLQIDEAGGLDNKQLIISAGTVTGHDSGIEIRGSRAGSNAVDQASLLFTNFDSDLASSNPLGQISGRVTNVSTNIGDMVFYSFDSGITKTEAMRIKDDGNIGILESNPEGNLHIGIDSATFLFGDDDARSTLTFRGNTAASGTFVDRYLINSQPGASANAHTWFSDTGSSAMTLANNGDLDVVGALSKGTGAFVIPHPDPVKREQGYRLKHCFVESNTAGDNIYRFECEATNDNQTVEIELPDYYKHLNENTGVWINGVNHFGKAYGSISEDETKLLITCEKSGKYKILCIGTRKDKIATDFFKEGPEYIPTKK